MKIRFKHEKLTQKEKRLEALVLIKNCRLSAAQSSSCGAVRLNYIPKQESQYKLLQKEK